ncbi:sulfotransferase [Synechococcus sp. KORDI-100]|uniref:sulfotransferase family protein n=1 Tax=Synechococcus sp. KORDI-100 TaxID=1280380 RepID=UPI00138E0F20|nr:sulfotransferase [Synechococcus sp. KORDI-100]
MMNFVICGAQKSGTSAFHSYLGCHPEISIAETKELHLFDNETRDWSDQGINKIDNEIEHFFIPSKQTKVMGEATPVSLWWKPAIERIWKYNPEMRLIAILRNPITRAYANWRMERLRGRETDELPLSLAQEEIRCRGALPLQDRVKSYLSRGFYTEQLRRAWQFFPRDQMLIIKQDDLIDQPETVLNKTYKFLGVSPQKILQKLHIPSWRAEISHAGKKAGLENLIPHTAPVATLNSLKDVYREEIEAIEKMLDWDCKDWLSLS